MELPGFTGIRDSGHKTMLVGIPKMMAMIPVFQKRMSAQAIE